MIGLKNKSVYKFYLDKIRHKLNLTLVYFLTFLLFFEPVYGYAGGITVDGSAPAGQRAGLDAAQNGVPVVNITNPNASGVSLNSFSDFNVDNRGVIMNNSLQVGVSQLGGALPGNPNFTGGKTAKIILNEVTSSNRSNIAGYTEIFGDKADYVLMNPNGITCNGCGFINTPRVTLSTGAVDMGADGSLKGFNVTGGDIKFEGQDINATNLDSFDIISRTASFASSVYAGNELNVITGSNHVDYNTKTASPVSSSQSPAPQIGIDSSTLGGMYAGKINLVATESGVGVNTQGKLGASAGDIKITADGRIEFKDANAKGDIKITSNKNSVKHSGNSYSEGKTEITAANNIELTDGFTASKSDIKINSASLDENSAASLMAGVDAVTSGSDVKFTNNGLGLLNIITTGTTSNAGLQSGASITANSGSFNNTGLVQSAGDITISAGSISNLNNYITVNGSLAGGISSGGKLTLTSTSGNIDNTGGALTSKGLLTIVSSADILNNSLVNSGSDIIISAINLSNRNSYAVNSSGYLLSGIIASGAANITTYGNADNTSGAISANSVTLNSKGQFTNDSGLINSSTTINASSVGLSNNDGAAIIANGDIAINAGGSDFTNSKTAANNTSGTIATSGNINVTGANNLTNTGLISGTSGIDISANKIDNSNSYITNQNGSLVAGILSHGNISLNSIGGDIINSSGAVFGGKLNLNSAGQVNNNAGLLQSDTTADISASGIDNSNTYVKDSLGNLVRGIFAHGINLIAGNSGINNSNGAVMSNGAITATTTGAVTNSGLVQSTGDTSITAASFINDNNYHTDNSGNLDKGILSGGKLDVETTGDVANMNGALYSVGKQTINAGGNATNSGFIAAGNDIGITGGGVSNSGIVTTAADTNLTAISGDVQNSGAVYGNNIFVTAANGNFNNDSGLTNSTGTATINSKGVVNTNTYHFTNGTLDKGIISTGGLTINAGTSGVNNGLNAANRGAIYTSGKANITATNGYVNNTGIVQSTGKLTVSACNINNSNSKGLVSSNDINLSARGFIKNINGYIAARNIDASAGGKFDNTTGSINSTGYTNISANGIDNTDTYITDNNGNIIGGIIAGGTIALGGGSGDIVNTGGTIIGTGNITLTTNGNIVNDSLIQGSNDITASATNIDNSNSYYTNNRGVLVSGMLAGGKIVVSGSVNNTDGAMSAGGDILITDAGTVTNTGLIQSDKNVNITSASIDNSNSRGIFADGDANLNATNGDVNNSSGAIVADNLNVTVTGNFNNTAGLTESSNITTITASGVNNDNTYVKDANGYLVKGIISGGDLTIKGQSDISNINGAILGGGKVTITTPGNFTNSGLVNAINALKITAAKINNSNSYALNNGSLSKGLISQSTIDLSATNGDIVNTDGAISSISDILLTATGTITNNSLIQSSSNIDINAASLDNSGSYEVDANGNLTKGILASSDINIRKSKNADGTINATGDVNNANGAIAGDNIIVTSNGAFTNTSGLMQGASDTTITAASIDNTHTEVVNSNGTITKGILTDGILTLTSTLGGINNTDGALSSGGNTVINSAGLFSNHSLVQSGGNLNITANGIDNSNSYAVTNGTLTGGLIAAGTITLQSLNTSLQYLTPINNNNGGISAGKTFSLSGSDIYNEGGYISANGLTGTSLVIAANNVDNQSGSILSKANLTMSGASGNNTAGGVISANNALNIQIANGGELDNTSGDIYSSNGSITGQNINNNGGRIQAANLVTITQTNGIFDNRSGTVLAFADGSTVTINAVQNILNQGGNIISIQNTDLNLANDYTINGNITTGGHVDITATAITNNAVVTAGDYIKLITASGDITNNSAGQLISGTSITLNSNGSINNYGKISGPIITLTTITGGLNNSGEITSSGILNANISRQLYNSGRISAEGIATINSNTLNNSGGQIASNDDLNITTTGNLSNSGGGLLYATNDIALHTSSLNNTSAYIFSMDGNVTLDKTAGVKNSSIINTSGQIESYTGDLRIDTDSLTNNRSSYIYVQQPRYSNGNPDVFDITYLDNLLDPNIPNMIANHNSGDFKYTSAAGDQYYYVPRVYNWHMMWFFRSKGSNAAVSSVLSGRDMVVNSTNLLNDGSQIAATRDMGINGNSVVNNGRVIEEWFGYNRIYGTIDWGTSLTYAPGQANTDIAGGCSVQGGPICPGESPLKTNIVQSSITAGRNLNATVGSIQNKNTYYGDNDTASIAATSSSFASISGLSTKSADTSATVINGTVQVTEVNNSQLSQKQIIAGAGSNIQTQSGIVAQQNNTGAISTSPIQGGLSQSGQQNNVIAVSNQPVIVSTTQTQNSATTTTSNYSSPTAIAINIISNLPTSPNGLFKIDTAPNARYVNVTNTPFADLNRFMGSDYLLTRIGYVPPANQKLLGDAFYDTDFVRQQIFERTGKRYLSQGISTDLAQMQALMDNAVAAKSALNLSVGIELTVSQIASLSSDIIWLVEQNINGQDVLVPVVYLAQATLDGLSGSAANISAGNDLTLTASNNITNTGAITAGHNVNLTAGSDITNTGGLIKAGNNVTLVSTNGDIINQAVIKHASNGSSFIRESLIAQGNITAGNNVILTAANNITNTASNITSTGNTTLTAGNDITIDTVALHNRTESIGKHSYSLDDTTTHVASNINSGGMFTANAGNDITVSGSNVTAVGNTNLNANNNVTIAAVQDTATHETQTSKSGFMSSSTYSKSTYDLTNKAATVSSTGGDVNINASNDVAMLASIVTSAGNTNINAGNQVTIASLSDDHEVHESITKKSGLLAKVFTGSLATDWLGLSKKDTNSSKDTIQTTVISSNITAANNLSSTSGGDTNIVASKLNAGGNVNITAGGAATIASASNTDYSETKDSSKSIMWQDMKDAGHMDSKVVNTEITSGGTTNISAVKGVTADVKNLTGDVQKDIATLSQQPGMAYLATLQNNPNAKFNQVSDAAKAWDYHSQGLTQEGAAIIAIAVTIATMGAGAPAGAAIGSAAEGAAIDAGATAATAAAAGAAANAATMAAMSSLASQAAISLANNKGDVGKTLKDLGSSDTVKNMAFAAVTAGATAGIASEVGLDKVINPSTQNPTGGANIGQRIDYATIQAGVGATADSAFNGGNFGDSFKSQLATGLAAAGGAWASGVASGQMTDYHGTVADIALQGAVGCAAGSAGGGNCGAGAVGGAIGGYAGANGYNTDTSRLAGAVGSLVTGGSASDINAAANTAEEQSGVVGYTMANVQTRPDLGQQLLDGYNQAASSKTAVVTPWGANNAIKEYTRYTETWLPGGDAAAKPAGVAVVDPNNNNIGLARILDENGKPSPMTGVSEGSLMSKALNDVPGFNSGSVPHDMTTDKLNLMLSNQGLSNPVTNSIATQGTIPFVILYNYYGLVGQTLSPNMLDSFQKAKSIDPTNKQ